MAHGFDCKRCGSCESAHDFPDDYPGVCQSYVSPDAVAEGIMWDIIQGNNNQIEALKRKAAGVQEG